MFRFPHRNADAYLRDATLDGASFMGSEVGRAVFDATADCPEALLQWCPQALLFGFWQSHLGKMRSQAKLAGPRQPMDAGACAGGMNRRWAKPGRAWTCPSCF
jgi:CRISPR-associated protein Csb1